MKKSRTVCILLILALCLSAIPAHAHADGVSIILVCSNCMHQVTADNNYCSYCGARLNTAELNPFSGWSEWSTTPMRATDTVEVQTRNVAAVYHMVHYGTQKKEAPHYRMFRDYSISGDLEWNGARTSYGEKHFTRDVTPKMLDYATRYEPGSFISGDYAGYQMGTSTAYSFGDDKYVWFVESVDEVTEYRWRYR